MKKNKLIEKNNDEVELEVSTHTPMVISKKENNKQDKKEIKIEQTSKEEVIIKKQNKKFWGVLFSGLIVLLVFFIVVGIINIFTFVKNFFADPQLGNVFGGLAGGLIFAILAIFVLRPLIIALSSPMFTLDIVDPSKAGEISRSNFKKMQKVAKNIIKTNDNVSQESKNLLRTFIHNKVELNNTLKMIYKKEIKKDIMKTINETSTKVMLTTAISQSNKFDALNVVLLNVRMIMQICVKCGYHPTYAKLSKLILKVYRNAIFAYAVQSFNLEDLVVSGVDKLVNGALSSIPFLKEVTKGLTQGASNALLTLRIGIITRKYLYEEYALQEKITDPDEVQTEIVSSAIKEANDNIDDIVKECKKKILIGRKNQVSVK